MLTDLQGSVQDRRKHRRNRARHAPGIVQALFFMYRERHRRQGLLQQKFFKTAYEEGVNQFTNGVRSKN